MNPSDSPALVIPAIPSTQDGATASMDSADGRITDATPSLAVDILDGVPVSVARRQRTTPPEAGTGSRFEEVITGSFDADEDGVAIEAPKRVLLPQPETPKLHKVLAQAGLGSRLEMEQLILEGRISVNGEPAHIGQRVQFGDTVKVNGKPIRVRIDPPPPRVIAYHKPTGEVVTHDDPQNRQIGRAHV